MHDLNLPPKGLFVRGQQIALPAGQVTAGQFTATTGRGDIRAIGITCAGGTLAQLADVVFTLDNNGESFIESNTLARYSSDYRNNGIIIIPIVIREGGTIQFSFNNASGVAIDVNIEQYYYDPSRPSFPQPIL